MNHEQGVDADLIHGEFHFELLNRVVTSEHNNKEIYIILLALLARLGKITKLRSNVVNVTRLDLVIKKAASERRSKICRNNLDYFMLTRNHNCAESIIITRLDGNDIIAVL